MIYSNLKFLEIKIIISALVHKDLNGIDSMNEWSQE